MKLWSTKIHCLLSEYLKKNLFHYRSGNKLKTSQHDYLDDLKETARFIKKIETGGLQVKNKNGPSFSRNFKQEDCSSRENAGI